MFKVTICDIGKMNINMIDKIEKKEATFAVPYNGEDNNDYVDGEVVQHIEYVPFGEVFVEERNNIGIRLIFSMRRNSMRRRDCITMGQGTMSQKRVCGLVQTLYKKNILITGFKKL